MDFEEVYESVTSAKAGTGEWIGFCKGRTPHQGLDMKMARSLQGSTRLSCV